MKVPGFFIAAVAAVAFAAVPAFSITTNATAAAPMQASAPDNSTLEASVHKKLSNGHFKDVTIAVNNGVVTLGGTVDLYQYKAEADDKAHHVSGVTAVDNEIQVESKPVTDAKLEQELAKKLAYDREGWPDAAFNSISLSVANGVVTLGGNAAVPWAKASAISLARNTPGVKDVIDNVMVDPESEVDNQTRIAVYRAVYGQAALNKYLIDPAKPIRITVVNGNVTLTGVVYDQMDKNIAGIQANTVPGVFKVTNNLAVANQGNEHR
jgi:hyperosmotically inducible protein